MGPPLTLSVVLPTDPGYPFLEAWHYTKFARWLFPSLLFPEKADRTPFLIVWSTFLHSTRPMTTLPVILIGPVRRLWYIPSGPQSA